MCLIKSSRTVVHEVAGGDPTSCFTCFYLGAANCRTIKATCPLREPKNNGFLINLLLISSQNCTSLISKSFIDNEMKVIIIGAGKDAFAHLESGQLIRCL
jgi:hypothetical protein